MATVSATAVQTARPLHVLMVPSFYPTRESPYNGTFFRDWAHALQRAGVRVGVAYTEVRGLRHLSLPALAQTRFQVSDGVEEGLRTVRIHGWNTLAQYPGGGIVWARCAQRVIGAYIERHGRPDLVAAQSAMWAGEAARLARRTWNLPYVITEITTGFGTGKVRGWAASISRRSFAGAEAVVAISQNLQQRLSTFGGVRRLELIPCTVDDAYWTPAPGARPLAPFTFYAQAHLTPRKGFDILIRAFARRFRGDSSVRLVIGGGGVIRPDLEALVDASGVRSQVTFLGAIPRDAVREAMRAADVFVLPSLAENFGVVLIEAMSTGLPVIGTRCGGPEDFIDDEVGVLTQPGDEDELAEALSRMRHTAFSAAAVRERTVRRFGLDVVGGQLRDLYRSVL